MQTHDNAFGRTCSAARDYTGLLTKMEEITDRLMEAIHSSDAERIDEVLQAREDLCGEIDRSSEKLSRLIHNIGDLQNKRNSPGDTAWHSLHSALDQIREVRTSLLKKQCDCEELLAARLFECKSQLLDLSRRQGLHSIYQKPAAKECSRFLDSRL